MITLALFAAAMYLMATLLRVPEQYQCVHCKTRTGEHGKDCPWNKRSN